MDRRLQIIRFWELTAAALIISLISVEWGLAIFSSWIPLGLSIQVLLVCPCCNAQADEVQVIIFGVGDNSCECEAANGTWFLAVSDFTEAFGGSGNCGWQYVDTLFDAWNCTNCLASNDAAMIRLRIEATGPVLDQCLFNVTVQTFSLGVWHEMFGFQFIRFSSPADCKEWSDIVSTHGADTICAGVVSRWCNSSDAFALVSAV